MANSKRPRTKTLEQKQPAPKRSKKEAITFPFLTPQVRDTEPAILRPILPPVRAHRALYHRPALLESAKAQASLLTWFALVSKDRDMPWRQKWINPELYDAEHTGLDLREMLKRRAYQVWVSEIMLQQTRVETVCAYYRTWHSKWPTIEDLAEATPEEVMGAWRGLGYYSRATRLHTAAKMVVNDPNMAGMLPESPEELEKKVPGVGRYTAGAISSIVFGHAVPILDGNVMRVLARQIGLYGNMSGKAVTSLLWEAADVLVKEATWNQLHDRNIARGEEESVPPKSDIPSFWNQALMELGSTVCKPQKAECSACPIKSTCVAYAEGEVLAWKAGNLDNSDIMALPAEAEVVDIEDLCTLCESMEVTITEEPTVKPVLTKKKLQKAPPTKPAMKQSTLSFRSINAPSAVASSSKETAKALAEKQRQAQDVIEKHVSLFPMKVIKKPQRKEEVIVCVIKACGDEDQWLIEQRPDKGLLASLWQFPSLTIAATDVEVDDVKEDDEVNEEEDEELDGKSRKARAKLKKKSSPSPPVVITPAIGVKSMAEEFVDTVLHTKQSRANVRHVKDLGSIKHQFSHIRMVMYIHVFEIDSPKSDGMNAELTKWSKAMEQPEYQRRKWANLQQVEDENLGTGMRKCWALVLENEKKTRK